MLNTPCPCCCFCDSEQGGCSVGQFCQKSAADGQITTPGVCRMFRSAEWKKPLVARFFREGAHKAGVTDYLANQAANELKVNFSYDLMVLYNQRQAPPEALKMTLTRMSPGARSVFVLDTTGFEGSENPAPDIAKEVLGKQPFKVERFVDPIIDPGQAIIRGSALVTAQYFLVVPAGRMVVGLGSLIATLQQPATRAVYYYFPVTMGNTLLVQPRSGIGMYLTDGYRALGKLANGEGLMDTIATAEKNTGTYLAWQAGGTLLR